MKGCKVYHPFVMSAPIRHIHIHMADRGTLDSSESKFLKLLK
jgi:hypothetical protein